MDKATVRWKYYKLILLISIMVYIASTIHYMFIPMFLYYKNNDISSRPSIELAIIFMVIGIIIYLISRPIVKQIEDCYKVQQK